MKRHLPQKAALPGMLSANLAAAAANPAMEVYKSEYCGCCSERARHLEADGFGVKARNVDNPSGYREKPGIPGEPGSCHTAFVEGYAFEGPAPATEARRLIAGKPGAKGLAVPAMPAGSPGMESPRHDFHDVLLVKANGSYSVYKHYN